MSIFNDLIDSKVDLISQQNFGLDLRNINNLSEEQKIKRIAIQFEEILLNTLLKDAFKFENKSKLGGGFNTLKDIRLMHLSQFIADNGGLGYQKLIEEQIKDYYQNKNQKEIGPLKIDPVLSLNQNQTNDFKFDLPVSAPVSSQYGWRIDPLMGNKRFHQGIDFKVPLNTSIKSMMEGEIVFSGWKKGYGNIVEIKHSKDLRTVYAHNSKLLCKEGDKVKLGDIIALSGSSGRSTGPHLHFEIRKGNIPVNPTDFFKDKNLKIL